MSNFDDNGKSTDPNDPDGINPLHPNYLGDPRYDQVRSKWAIAHSVEKAGQEGVDKGFTI
jgi:hypothetical protein